MVFIGLGLKNEALTPKIEVSGRTNQGIVVFIFGPKMHVSSCCRLQSKTQTLCYRPETFSISRNKLLNHSGSVCVTYPRDGCLSAAMGRSAFGKVFVDNLLPIVFAEQQNTKGFQRKLQHGLKQACRAKVGHWPNFLSDGVKHLSANRFQEMFSNM